MITNDRRRSDGVSDKNSNENEVDIHNHAICRNTIFSCIFDQLQIVQHVDQRHRNVGHQFGRTVKAGFSKCIKINLCRNQLQCTAVLPDEADKWDHSANYLADSCCQCRTDQTIPQYTDQHKIQNNIGKSCCHRDHQSKGRLLCRHKKTLEYILQHKWG